LRILEVLSTPLPPTEGIGNYVIGLSTQLIELGHEVTIVTRKTRGTSSSDSVSGANVVRLGYLPAFPFHVNIHGRFVKEWIRSIRKKPDVVHLHSPLVPALPGPWMSIATFHTPLRADTRYLELSDPLSLPTRLFSPFAQRLERQLLRSASAVTAVSGHVLDEVRGYGVPLRRTHILPNAVDPHMYSPTTDPSDDMTLLYVGRLTARKGLPTLLRAVADIRNSGTEVRLQIVGQGTQKAYIVREASRLHLDRDAVRFEGFVSKADLLGHYRRASIVVLPSSYEGLPTALLEAMSCGKAVVTTDIPGVRDAARHGENAWLVKPESVTELTQGICTLLRDPDLRRRLGKNARSTVLRAFTWPVVTREFLALVAPIPRG